MMKRIHWFSLFLGMFIALGLVSACHMWRSNDTQSAPMTQTTQTAPSIVQPKNNSTDEIASPAKNSHISYSALPPEAQSVIAAIKSHGTFRFAQDSKTFQNRERLLPQQPRGYYQEYTVVTPNASNRGARRIVAGKGATGDVATAGEFYYTSDHYRSFYRVKE